MKKNFIKQKSDATTKNKQKNCIILVFLQTFCKILFIIFLKFNFQAKNKNPTKTTYFITYDIIYKNLKQASAYANSETLEICALAGLKKKVFKKNIKYLFNFDEEKKININLR